MNAYRREPDRAYRCQGCQHHFNATALDNSKPYQGYKQDGRPYYLFDVRTDSFIAKCPECNQAIRQRAN